MSLRREDGALRLPMENVRSDLNSETDSQGRFEFTPLALGIYRLEATDGKFRRVPAAFEGSSRTGIVVAEGASIHDLILRLPGFGRVTGRVVGPDGKGVVGALALARGKDWILGDFQAIPRTDGEGRFEIEGLPIGEVSITAVKQSFVASVEARATVRAGETAEVELSLVSGTRLRFRGATNSETLEPFGFLARDDRGQEWALYPGWIESPQTSTDEEFDDPRYGPLPAGDYEISVTSGNGRTWRGSADLRGEAEVTVPMKLDP